MSLSIAFRIFMPTLHLLIALAGHRPAWLRKLMFWLLVLCALAQPARADLVFVIDVSLSSPAMQPKTGEKSVLAAAQKLAPRIGQLALGSRLVVFNVGSRQERGTPVLDKLIQRVRTPTGDTAAAYQQAFAGFVTASTAERRSQQQGTQSHLTAGVATARSMVRKGQPCEIWMLSDLAEWDGQGLQYPRDWSRPLPTWPGLDLQGCTMHVMGAWQGMSPQQAKAIEQHWQRWLRAAGAQTITLEPF